jgi:hypothetical protein
MPIVVNEHIVNRKGKQNAFIFPIIAATLSQKIQLPTATLSQKIQRISSPRTYGAGCLFSVAKVFVIDNWRPAALYPGSYHLSETECKNQIQCGVISE